MVFPLVWVGVSAVVGVATGLIYEKESNKKIVEIVADSNNDKFSSIDWKDKAIMAAAGIAAFWVYRSTS